MKNYRIQKLSYGDYVRYVPQQKVFGLFWWNVFNDDFTQYHSYEKAKKANEMMESLIEDERRFYSDYSEDELNLFYRNMYRVEEWEVEE